MTIQLLMIEDHIPDVKLTQRAFRKAAADVEIDVVCDGVDALSYLRKEGRYADKGTPDLILLDLNMPRKDGRQVLQEMAQDDDLRRIPVIVLTTSGAEKDVKDAYLLGANAYVTKPVSFPQFEEAVESLGDFWLKTAVLG